MSGLDNILSRLDNECKAVCEDIINSARSEAERIIGEAEKSAEKAFEEKTAAAKKEAELIVQKAVSASQANDRKSVLGAKVELIDDILNKALNKLYNLDEMSYFEVLRKLAVNNSLEGKGTMFLSQRDIERMPSGFADAFSDIEICREPIDIKDGFILKYGDIEVNCTFSAMMSSSKDELKSIASEILFG
ncbi:MAG: hypothetical protein E7573_02955 [Ruminococcaceae bacterium]|nr:hypothetical protein [Oscillospiraceae bacterium]